MIDIEEYIRNNIKHNQNIINNPKIYSVKSIIIKLLIKSGIILDYAYPYILSALILLNSSYFKSSNLNKFESKTKTRVEEIYDNHNNYVINTNIDEFLSNKDLIIYTTPWELIDNRYVGTKIILTININYLNEKNIPKILQMNYDQLLLHFNVYSKETIYKDNSNEEENTITIIYHSTIDNKKDIIKNKLNILLYLTLNILGGLGLSKVNKIIIKSKTKDKLNELDNEPVIYGKDEINRLNDIIQNEKDNLEFINNKQDKPKLRIK